MDSIKVGVIGYGYWGPKLARNFSEIPGSRLEWVADMDVARLAEIKGHYPGVMLTRDYRQLLDSDLDAVVIATPARTHYRLAMDALQAGKHILVEKPLAACVDQAKEIVSEATRCGRVVMVGHTFVYNPAVIAIRQIIQRGYLGEIYYINGIRVNLGLFQPDINVLWDLAPHDLSMMIYMMGSPPVTVSAHGGVFVQRSKGFHEVAFLNLDFPAGEIADLRVSWLDPIKVRLYTIVGSECMLVYDDLEQANKITIHDKGVDIPPYSVTEDEFRCSYRTGDGVPYPVEWTEPLKLECQDFLDSIRQGKQPVSNGELGLQVIRTLEAAQCSLLKGGSREVVGENRGFCAHRTRRESGPRCQELCLCEPLWL